MALNINGSTGISGVDGSASAPALQGTDSNTGINFASDTVNINTAGVQSLSIDSTGNLNAINHLRWGSVDKFVFSYNGGSSSQVRSGIKFDGTNQQVDFYTSTNERMRLSSGGSLLIGRTTATSFGSLLQIKSIDVETNGDTTGMTFNRTDSNAAWVAMRFYVQGSQKGYIQVNTGSVTYSTSSDYRLKENVVSISDGITRLKQLKPYRFNFKSDSSTTLDGFYAHEASEVVPESVVGTKDAVDSEGNIDPQGIDQSKIVPLLTAALQEAVTKIEVLETRLNNAGIAT